ITFAFVTHDQEEALTMSDRIALLQSGDIVQLGTPEELYDSPSCRYAAEFIGVSNILNGSRDGDLFIDRGSRSVLKVAGGARDGNALMVRPERLRVAAGQVAPDAHENALPAVVRDCVYLGSDRTVHVRTESGEE